MCCMLKSHNYFTHAFNRPIIPILSASHPLPPWISDDNTVKYRCFKVLFVHLYSACNCVISCSILNILLLPHNALIQCRFKTTNIGFNV